MDDKARLISPPPRQVPFSVAVKLLFGDFSNLFGWIFFGFGMIFFWGFAMNADFSSFLYSGISWASATGASTGSSRTCFSEGGSKHRSGTPIYANHFRFRAADGNEYEGVSFTKGSYTPSGSGAESAVETVSVQYVSSNPRISRIAGQRLRPFGPDVIFVVIFPFVGLCFLSYGLIQGFKALRLLSSGDAALGTLEKKEATNVEVNNRRVYALTFSFKTKDGTPAFAVSKTNEPEKLEDDTEERLFYDPVNPSRAVLFDSLPGGVGIDERGEIFDPSPMKSWLYLIAPAVTILGHGTYVFFAYFR
ncbi:MAG: hypothetical protein AB2L14_22905 [Candidatus Xenobiia bacterium LiM19]